MADVFFLLLLKIEFPTENIFNSFSIKFAIEIKTMNGMALYVDKQICKYALVVENS